MFERFTETARRVIVEAQTEARGMRHNYIGTEHLLLGLFVGGDSIATEVLMGLGLTADGVRQQIVQAVGPGEEAWSGQIPFTPRAKKVMEMSLREALSLGSNEITSGHLLLALLREDEGLGTRVLLQHGADAESIREAVLVLLRDPKREPLDQPSVRRVPARQGASFTAVPGPDVMAVLMSAAGKALSAGRTEYSLEDLRAALSDRQGGAAAG
jgi:ATP-dependent Clp protease ATP-binding subunit ClpA